MEEEKKIVLRILDANANRCAEGLRVVEEIARFAMGNEALFIKLKGIRHSVRRGMEALAGAPYRFRESASDVGKGSGTVSESYRGSLSDVAGANFSRSEEALRVLEEFGKLVGPEPAAEFKRLRFELYGLERNFFEGDEGAGKLPPAPFLYGILDRGRIPRSRLARSCGEMVKGGVDIVQYRAKSLSRGEARADLLSILPVASEGSVPVIVNDDPELAAETGAAGVHLGRGDPPPSFARSVMGSGGILGVTVHSMEELENISLGEIDYVAAGSIFPSPTKPDTPAVGLDFLRRVRESLRKPLVAIGGIDQANVASVLEAGADGIAMISALLSGDIRKNCFTFKEIVDRRKQNDDIAR